MYKFSVVILLISFLTGCGEVHNRCEHLISLPDNSIALREARKLLLKLEKAPSVAQHFKKNLGVIYVKDLEEDLDIDWSVFGIPMHTLTFSLNGTGVDYLKLNFEKVDSLSVGYGHRQHFVINISGKKFFGIEGLVQFKEQITRINDEFSVICR